MSKAIVLILLGLIAVVVYLLVFKSAKENLKPLAASPSELLEMERQAFSPDDPVVVTLDNSGFHRPECTEIRGNTNEMTYAEALRAGFKPCSMCIREAAAAAP